MGEHRVHLDWRGDGRPFTYESYSRNHTLTFKDGVALTVSASPAFRGDGAHADPEDLLVAALSSCHMLSFLALCAKARLVVEDYRDDAVGFLENAGGKRWMTRVILRPRVRFAAAPGADILARLHHQAHDACFIANSVKTDVRVELDQA